MTVKMRRDIELETKRSKSIKTFATRIVDRINKENNRISLSSETEEKRDKEIQRNNAIMKRNNELAKNMDLNMDDLNEKMQLFNDGIDGIMELPQIDEKKDVELEDKRKDNKYQPKKVDMKNLNQAMSKFQQLKENFENDSKERKRSMENKKKLYGINRKSNSRDDIPSYSKAEILWKFPKFQRIKSNGSIKVMG